MQTCWPCRSLLFLPAHRIEWVRKIERTMPDAVILDLEDAVPPQRKAEARALLPEAIAILQELGIAPLVRVNALGAGCEVDVDAAVQPGLLGVMLPKVHHPRDVAALDLLLAQAEARRGMPPASVGIVPLPESAQGLWLAHEIAAASPRVVGLVTAVSGAVTGDVARAAGYRPTEDGAEQLFVQSRTILASRAAGANFPIGTLLPTDLGDEISVRRLARRARQLGFTGAALIHPFHVAIAHEVFTPSDYEVAEATGLLQAVASAQSRGLGAVTYRGAMADAAMVAPAEELLAAHARFKNRDEVARARLGQLTQS